MKVISIIILFIITSSLGAEETKLKKGLLERMVQPKVSLQSSYLSDANIENSKASVKVVKNSIKLNNAIGGISYTNWSFLWNDIGSLPFGNGADTPIKQVHKVKLHAHLPYFINDKWFLLTSLSINATFEKEMQDSLGAGIFSFASYKINDNHTIEMGAFANYHRVATLALPVISYSYRARQKDGLQVVLGFPRAYVGYYMRDKILLRSGMVFSQSLIKLSDASSIENSGYIELKDYMSNIGIVYEMSSHFTLESDVLYSLKRDFTIYNSTGNEQNSYNIKPSLGMSFRLKYLF